MSCWQPNSWSCSRNATYDVRWMEENWNPSPSWFGKNIPLSTRIWYIQVVVWVFFHQEYDRLQHILTKAKPPELFLGTLQNPFLDGLRLSSPKQTHKRWFGQNYAELFRLTVPANERQTGKNRLRIRQKQNKNKRENRNMSRRFADSPMFDIVETLPIHLSE